MAARRSRSPPLHDRPEPPHLSQVHHPHDDGLDDSAASTGLGRVENSGASTSSVSRTVTPEVTEARSERAPERSFSELADRLVETGIPWNRPAPMLAVAWATDSWSMSIW